MATPTLNLNYTVLSTCDATSGWSGGSTEPDIKKQGTNSLAVAIRNNGTYTYTTGGVNMSAADTHLRLWLFHSFASYLETKANGGIQLFVTGGGTNYYNVGGSDTHNGSWELFQANLAAPDVDGSANLSNITAAGFRLNHATAARNVVNTWWDYFVYGTGYEVKGGTSVDSVTWADLATYDAAQGIGLVQEQNGVYFLNGELVLGDRANGTTDTYFDGSNEVAVFYDTGESTTLYKVIGDGGGATNCELTLNGMVLKSASTAFNFNMGSADITSLEIDGSTVDSAAAITFASGQSILNSVFRSCGQIIPGAATFTGNNVVGYTGTDGALLWPGGTSVSGSLFSNNTRAIEHDTAGTYTYTDLRFSGNTYDINNTSGGSVTINASGTSNPSTFLGTVTINNTKNFTFTIQDSGGTPQTGYEWRLYERDPTTGIIGTTELDGEEIATLSTQTYSYNYSGDTDVMLQIIETGYEEYLNQFVLGDADQNVTINLITETNL
jgi:hypothetical protein